MYQKIKNEKKKMRNSGGEVNREKKKERKKGRIGIMGENNLRGNREIWPVKMWNKIFAWNYECLGEMKKSGISKNN